MSNPIADLELRKIRLEFDYWMQKARESHPSILSYKSDELEVPYVIKIVEFCKYHGYCLNTECHIFDLIMVYSGELYAVKTNADRNAHITRKAPITRISYDSETFYENIFNANYPYEQPNSFIWPDETIEMRIINSMRIMDSALKEMIDDIIHEVKRRVANHLTTSTANLTMTCLDISNGVTELSSTVDNLSQITQTTQDQVDNLVEDRKTMNSTVSELKQLVEIVVGETIHLNNTICTMQKQINSLLSNEHHMKEENADLRKSIKTLKQDNADIKQAISELVDYQNTLEKDNAILKCEVNLLKSQSNVYPSYDYGAIRDRMDVYRDELIHIQRIMSRFARRNVSIVG